MEFYVDQNQTEADMIKAAFTHGADAALSDVSNQAPFAMPSKRPTALPAETHQDQARPASQPPQAQSASVVPNATSVGGNAQGAGAGGAAVDPQQAQELFTRMQGLMGEMSTIMTQMQTLGINPPPNFGSQMGAGMLSMNPAAPPAPVLAPTPATAPGSQQSQSQVQSQSAVIPQQSQGPPTPPPQQSVPAVEAPAPAPLPRRTAHVADTTPIPDSAAEAAPFLPNFGVLRQGQQQSSQQQSCAQQQQSSPSQAQSQIASQSQSQSQSLSTQSGSAAPQYVRASTVVPSNRGEAPRSGSGSYGRGGRRYGSEPQQESNIICFVEFKRGRVRRYDAVLYVTPGQYVIVDGDRGQDCGLVVQCMLRAPDGTVERSETLEGVNVDPNKVKAEQGSRVLRVALERETDMLHGEIATLERYALKTCRERVTHMGLNMDVVDCEFQFDRKKVTFFFDSPEAIDFRELTKDLFKIFGSRIWLENINSRVKNVVPEGALSHADKMLFAERGLRPPRR